MQLRSVRTAVGVCRNAQLPTAHGLWHSLTLLPTHTHTVIQWSFHVCAQNKDTVPTGPLDKHFNKGVLFITYSLLTVKGKVRLGTGSTAGAAPATRARCRVRVPPFPA